MQKDLRWDVPGVWQETTQNKNNNLKNKNFFDSFCQSMTIFNFTILFCNRIKVAFMILGTTIQRTKANWPTLEWLRHEAVEIVRCDLCIQFPRLFMPIIKRILDQFMLISVFYVLFYHFLMFFRFRFEYEVEDGGKILFKNWY